MAKIDVRCSSRNQTNVVKFGQSKTEKQRDQGNNENCGKTDIPHNLFCKIVT